MHIGERIRELRRSCRLTQAGLADLAGVDCVTVSRWERGRAMPGLEQLRAVERALGVPVFDGDRPLMVGVRRDPNPAALVGRSARLLAVSKGAGGDGAWLPSDLARLLPVHYDLFRDASAHAGLFEHAGRWLDGTVAVAPAPGARPVWCEVSVVSDRLRGGDPVAVIRWRPLAAGGPGPPRAALAAES